MLIAHVIHMLGFFFWRNNTHAWLMIKVVILIKITLIYIMKYIPLLHSPFPLYMCVFLSKKKKKINCNQYQ